jgi:hypothetical protein
MITQKIGLIYYSARKMKRKMNYKLAQKMADRFTHEQLLRIYKRLGK